MKRFISIALMLVLSFGLAACNTVGKVLPPNDEVLVYPLSYDLTYLRTMEAVDGRETWKLEETDKEKGTITVRDTNYSSLNDSDKRVITFQVKRLDRGTSSVSIAPDSQKVYGGADLMKAVAAALGRETHS